MYWPTRENDENPYGIMAIGFVHNQAIAVKS